MTKYPAQPHQPSKSKSGAKPKNSNGFANEAPYDKSPTNRAKFLKKVPVQGLGYFSKERKGF